MIGLTMLSLFMGVFYAMCSLAMNLIAHLFRWYNKADGPEGGRRGREGAEGAVEGDEDGAEIEGGGMEERVAHLREAPARPTFGPLGLSLLGVGGGEELFEGAGG